MRVPKPITTCVCAAVLLVATGHGDAQQRTPDLILTNGKIVTVDDRFRVAQAVAVAGARIVAVGTNQEVAKLAGVATRQIDLGGKTVIPGLIDNHAHFMRAAEYWDREVRWDGVTSRKQALEMIAARSKHTKQGEWMLVLGGWSLEQFIDSQQGFAREELDRVAPDNPVLLQLIYFRIYTNGAGLRALGIDATTKNPPGGTIEKSAAGEPTGELNGASAVRMALGRLGGVPLDRMTENARALTADLNKLGLTTFVDMGGRDFQEKHFEPFRRLARERALTVRAFHYMWLQPEGPADVDGVIGKIKEMRPFQGDDYLDHVGYGETVYFPLHDNLLAATAAPTQEAMVHWRRIAQAVADSGMGLVVHAQLRGSIEAFLTAIEAINTVKPIRGLRWTLSHADQLEPKDIERLRRLGMYVQIHSRPAIQGRLMAKVHGERSQTMPPLRLIQDSALRWGLGSDATAVTPSNPFYTLWWAVTGEMIGGAKVSAETLTREEALIAHTRANAYFAFREADLGSIQTGKYADLLVLDRDYLTVPVEAIKDLKPLMTIVGGKIVYDAKSL